MEGSIVSIYIASLAGAPITAITTAHLVPGRGIKGDRFYVSRGNGEATDATACDVTFVEQEALEALKSEEPQANTGDTARRNIVISGCSLQPLIGRTFRIGEIISEESHRMRVAPRENSQQATSCMALHMQTCERIS